MRVQKKANILLLPNIKKDDFVSIDDVFENRLLQTACGDNYSNDEIYSSTIYDKIPTRFYNITLWPKQTNLKCWNCDGKCKSFPWFIPTRLFQDEVGDEYFEVKGNFCTLNCVYSYTIKCFKESECIDIHARLIHLYEKIFKTHIIKIPASPNKEEKIEYGGELTTEEFEKEIERRNNEQNLLKYKLEHFRFDKY